MVAGFRAEAARAVGLGRRLPKGAAIKEAQFACTPEMLLHHKVEVIAPALTDWRLCQTAAYTAAMPTVRRLCLTWGQRTQPNRESGFANIWQRLCQGNHHGATPSFQRRQRPLRAREAGTAAVASATWSAHHLDLWHGGHGRDPDRCSLALSYLLIKLMLKIFINPPFSIIFRLV